MSKAGIRLAILHSTMRKEEKLIQCAALNRNLDVKLIDIRNEMLNPASFKPDFEIALERSVSMVKGNYATSFLETLGVPVVNPSSVALVCADKFLTSSLLFREGIPTAKFVMVFTLEQAARAVDELGGFPVVVKPPLGSWGRLLAKVNDIDALEAVLEHKDVLGTPPQKAFYIQEYVKKPGRDIRAFVVGTRVICAIYRESSHWITNTARSGKAFNCPLSEELTRVCGKAAEALGGGLLAMDLFETDDGLKINEINHTMEFRNSEEPTGVNIAQAIIDYCLERIDQKETMEANSMRNR